MKKPTFKQLKRVKEIRNYYEIFPKKECDLTNSIFKHDECTGNIELRYILLNRKDYNILVFCNCKKHINQYSNWYIKNRLSEVKVSPLQKFTVKELFTISIL